MLYFIVGSSIPIRLKLLQDGINIAIDHFPLGAGFGTFGTTVAYDSGSSFYYNLDYMSGYYMNKAVGDAFWLGIFSTSGWCMLSIIIYSVIASTSETAFFNPATALMFLLYGIASASHEKSIMS